MLEMARANLEPLEDFILLSLAKRQRIAHNPSIYVDGKINGLEDSLLDSLLEGRENIEGAHGRYLHHQEVPFFPKEHGLRVSRDQPENPLYPISVNVNDSLKKEYIKFISIFCPGGDIPSTHGTAASYDVEVLQEISRRVHLGRHIAEAKFMLETEKYTRLIKDSDEAGIMKALTDEVQEGRVLERVVTKASKYGVVSGYAHRLYEEILIPKTKVVEVNYLMLRLDPVNLPLPIR